MTTSIARLLVLLPCINHVLGCAWWYLGTVFIPEGFDGTRPDGWHRHSAIPSTNFLKDSFINTVNLQGYTTVNSSGGTDVFARWKHAPTDNASDIENTAGDMLRSHIEDVEIDVFMAGSGTTSETASSYIGDLDLENKIPTIYISGEWVPLSGPVPSVDKPAAFDSWVMYYQGLGVAALWPDRYDASS